MTGPRRASPRPGIGRIELAALVLGALTRPLSAQLPTEGIPSDRVLAPREEISRAIEASRFNLGALRLTPVVSIDEMTYDNNVYGTAENPIADFRMTVSAGLGLILPVSTNFFFRADVFPSYTWYAELKEKRFFGGRYGASFLVFANRLTLEGSAGISRADVTFSSEAPGRVIRDLESGRLGAEVRLLTRLYLYGEGRIQRFRFTGSGAESAIFDPSTTDRTDRALRAELRYKWTDTVRVAAGYEETRSDFVLQPELYDNQQKSVVGTVYFERPKLFLRASGGYSQIEPVHGSAILPFSGVIGSGFGSYPLLSWLELQAFGGRSISYGLSSPYYLSTRYGGGVVFKMGWRLKVQGFASAGTDDYSTPFLVPGGELVDRKDSVTTYGGGLDFILAPRVLLRFVGSEQRYTSNVPGYDRTYFRWFVSAIFGGNLLAK